jgi:hypothetical protein
MILYGSFAKIIFIDPFNYLILQVQIHLFLQFMANQQYAYLIDVPWVNYEIFIAEWVYF